MPKTRKTSADAGAETEKLIVEVDKAIESNLDEDGDFELSTDANDASRCLAEVRRAFYGTPVEKLLTDAIIVCDIVAQKAAG